MKRINIKKVVTIIAIMMIVISFSSVVFGASALDPNSIRPIDNPGVNKVQTIAGYILAIAQAIGISFAVIMLIVIAIKYFMASGAQEKAKIKESATAYIIASILLFGGVAILQLIQGFATKM